MKLQSLAALVIAAALTTGTMFAQAPAKIEKAGKKPATAKVEKQAEKKADKKEACDKKECKDKKGCCDKKKTEKK